MPKQSMILYAGDTMTIAFLTIIGFASHKELEVSLLPCLGAAFFPAVISWFGIAPWFGLFDSDGSSKLRSLWRVALAASYASTMAAFLRGLILGSDIPPVFILVLAGSTAMGMMAWRWSYSRLNRK